jgi:hypothetical protein
MNSGAQFEQREPRLGVCVDLLQVIRLRVHNPFLDIWYDSGCIPCCGGRLSERRRREPCPPAKSSSSEYQLPDTAAGDIEVPVDSSFSRFVSTFKILINCDFQSEGRCFLQIYNEMYLVDIWSFTPQLQLEFETRSHNVSTAALHRLSDDVQFRRIPLWYIQIWPLER